MKGKPSAWSIDAKAVILILVELVEILCAHFVDDGLVKDKEI